MIESYTEERIEHGTDRPAPTPGVMQVIYKNGVPYAVDFICPCGCGSSCYTPLKASNREPSWAYSPGPTLTPSIRWTGGCKAHFNITDGKTIIHGDSGK